LLDYVQTAQIDLVVMTAHGRSGLTRSGLGSVADRVTRGGTAAVLLVPAT
jgi:nucleotide-binding universal stress UspA family protein